MARQDYRRKTRGRKAASGPRWNWFVGGFALGVLLTVGLFTSDLSLETLLGGGRSSVTGSDSSGSTPDAQGDDDKPRFEFYTLLPEMEVAVPEEELETQATRTAAVEETPAPTATASAPAEMATPAAATADDAYILQVGSFRSPDEADRLRANLVLLGLDASVQTVAINGEDAWHRVRIGPYRDLVSLNDARVRLRENGISVKVWRVTDGSG